MSSKPLTKKQLYDRHVLYLVKEEIEHTLRTGDNETIARLSDLVGKPLGRKQ